MADRSTAFADNAARKYQMKRRAESAASTRRRITDAAVALHASIGPAQTTIAGIAEKAGVTRLTVYRHFPTNDELFGACSARWLFDHPWPNVESWKAIRDPNQRMRTALTELYGFFRSNETMIANLQRDLDTLPAANQERLRARPRVMAKALMEGRGVRGRTRHRVQAWLIHAVEFETWRSFARRQGLSDTESIELVSGAIR